MAVERARREWLSEKEIEVLEVFFRHTPDWSVPAATVSDESGRKHRDDDHFTPKVSKTGARTICDRLVARKLLDATRRRTQTNGLLTPHYAVVTDSERRRRLVLLYLLSLQEIYGELWTSHATSPFLSGAWARDYLAEGTVREILAQRNVAMNVRVHAPESLGRPSDRDRMSPGRSFHLHLPVGAPSQTAQLARNAIEMIARDEKLEPAALTFLRSFVETHYDTLEAKRLVIPIVALLQVSPRAVVDFLSTWKAYDAPGISEGLGMIEHVLFRMVFDAVQDLSQSRNTPDGVDVVFAEVCPEHGGCIPDQPTLLQLTWQYEYDIGYLAGFDTDHTLIFGEDVEAGGVEPERNPENCWVKIAWVKRPPLPGRPPEPRQEPLTTPAAYPRTAPSGSLGGS